MSKTGTEWARLLLAMVFAAVTGLFVGGVLGLGSMVALDALPSVREQMDGIEIVLLPFMGGIGGVVAGPIGVMSSLAARRNSRFSKVRSTDVVVGGVAAVFCFGLFATILLTRDIAAGRSIWTSTKVLIVLELIVAAVAGGGGGWIVRRSFLVRRSDT